MIALLLLACAAGPPVLVVVTDTTRADLGGAEWPALVSKGRRYTSAWSSAPYTSSATWTIVGGGLPVDGARMPPRWVPRGAWPDEAWPATTITDSVPVARMAGTGLWGDPWTRARGAVNAGTTPIHLHVLGPHSPYDGSLTWGPSSTAAEYTAATQVAQPDLSPELAAWGMLQYRAAVDRTLAEMVPLVESALAAGYTVIWTSDHGEAFGEGGRWEHGRSLDDDQIHVPLVVWGPGVDPGEDPAPTGAHCVASTVRRVLGEQDHGCDLQNGLITGLPVAGMCLAHDGYRCTQWTERRHGEATP